MQSHKPRTSEILLALACLMLPLSAQADPWVTHASKLPQLTKQVANLEEEIKTLIEHQRHSDDPKAVHEILKTISSKHKELEKTFKDFQEERDHVRFRHPDKAEVTEKQYSRQRLKSVADLEGEMGLDGKLDKLKKRVLNMFPSAEVDRRQAARDAAKEARKPASEQVDEDAIEQVHLSK